jgi:mRNA interferase HigB
MSAMTIISIAILKRFWEQSPGAEQPLEAWLNEAQKANWPSPMEIKELYLSACILKNSRV